jgi:hypothetical protein
LPSRRASIRAQPAAAGWPPLPPPPHGLLCQRARTHCDCPAPPVEGPAGSAADDGPTCAEVAVAAVVTAVLPGTSCVHSFWIFCFSSIRAFPVRTGMDEQSPLVSCIDNHVHVQANEGIDAQPHRIQHCTGRCNDLASCGELSLCLSCYIKVAAPSDVTAVD